MSKFRVVVTDDRFGSYDEEKGILEAIGCDLEVLDLTDSWEAAKAFRGADGLLINMFPVTAELIGKLDGCRILSRYGVGYDNVDVEAATQRGIWVARVPDYGYEEVSDHALAMLMGLARNLTYVDRRVREGGWNLKNEYRNQRIRGRVLGLVGFGRIGKALARKVQSLGLSRVLANDPYVPEKVMNSQGVEKVDLATIVRESDYLSIHVPLNDETKGLIGEAEFRRMKPNAILINTSRGRIVDERALEAALAAGALSAAGLDVFESEPLPADSRLRQFDRVILSDHTAYYSDEALVELKTKAAQNVVEVLQGRQPLYAVNKPVS